MIRAVVLLVCFFYQTEGGVMPDDPPVIQISSDDFTDSSSKRSLNNSACCESGNFTAHSLANILNNISAIVNITNDIVLSSNVTLEGLENITIIGHRNPVVHCNDAGALRFISCKNVTIEGIQWEGCGSKDYPSIEFYNSSNISFERCSFHNSKGRSVVLSKVSGNIYINNCNFTHNNQYSGHGAAIHYLPNTSSSHQPNLVIQHSKFVLNRATQSIVYIDGSVSRIPGNFYLKDSVFINNTGVPVYISHTNVHIRGRVLFKGNAAKSGGGIYSKTSTVTFYKTDVSFIGNFATANGGAIYQTNSRIMFIANSIVKFEDNTAPSGGGITSNNSSITFDGNSSVTFNTNKASNDGDAADCNYAYYIILIEWFNARYYNNYKAVNFGGAVVCQNLCHVIFGGNSIVQFYKNSASDAGGAVYCSDSSRITFYASSIVAFNNNTAYLNGGAIYCTDSSQVIFDGSSTVSFNSNVGGAGNCKDTRRFYYDNNFNLMFYVTKLNFGGAIVCLRSSHIQFVGNSSVTLNKNTAKDDGGAVFCLDYSLITFDDNTSVTFSNNMANNHGGAIRCLDSSHITIDGDASVLFHNNSADANGGAVNLIGKSHIIFDGNSSVVFKYHSGSNLGGALHCSFTSYIAFYGNSYVMSYNNEASFDGGAVYCSNITFHETSRVNFTENVAGRYGGAVYCDRLMSSKGTILFLDSTLVSFSNNLASSDGGAVWCKPSSIVIFENNSTVILNNNTAGQDGGAIVSSSVTFTGSSNVMFYNNLARRDGAAIHYISNCNILFGGNSSVIFYNNTAVEQGGAIYLIDNAIITIQQHCNVTFLNNTARESGGAIYLQSHSICLLEEHSEVTFTSNKATKSGGAVYLESLSNITLEGNTGVTFKGNKASQSAGALFITDFSTASFTGHSKVTYSNNEITQYGGAIYCDSDSNIITGGNTTVQFVNNTSGYYGGAVSILHSFMLFKEDSLVRFIGNKADSGAAISAVASSVTFANSTQAQFLSNSAGRSGGAMHLSNKFILSICSDCHITFYSNTADRHGGAMYCDLTKSTDSKITLNTSDIAFEYNADFVGSDIYMDITRSCDETCLDNLLANEGYGQFNGIIKTSPRQLEFNDSKVICVDNDNDTYCETYLTRNIMLGQNIMLNACPKDYYNQPVGSTQFVLNSQDQNYRIIGSNNVLTSCSLSKEISIMGKRVLVANNFSLTFTLYDGSNSELKKFSIELIIELSPCHPGFHYDNNTQTCVCYSDRDIVSCSGSTSSIKRGYWSGEINDKATATVCPNSYCNFSCCETLNEFIELSPFRVNQCNSHRSGPACGSCKKGYTLSFDSIECVSVDKCTAGQTVLVVTLSILYWVVIVILVFIVTYYHIGIGYLYAITYYYSMVDILLGEHLYLSQGLFNLIITLSSIAKVTPQFLGQLCLLTNMSGIDQQFIHYAHPLAVAVIVTLICVAARISYRLSSLVGRRIIHVICLLLLLSYTSVATTSLLLLRSLTFDNIDKTYTYLSPDIMYLHGRHLPYFIAAILCTIVILVGLPFLLLFEPYLNHKINFTRIKPLLDQFQGCYKDKYRSFAAYYMTCRLVIILIIIANPSNHDNSQYLLIILNSLLAFIHVTLRPYKSNILNVFDSFVLQLMIVVSMVPLIDNYDRHLLITFMFLLVILPLIPFVGMEVFLYKKTIKKFMRCCVPPKPDTTHCQNVVTMTDSVVDDGRRVKVTVCEI